jgi:hypothetical protein
MPNLEVVRVCIGTEPKTEIARKVLECSVTRHTDARVEFYPMLGKGWEYSTSGIQVGTGFSLRRWMIPAFFGWQGKAIYLDADQLVFGDILELWHKPAGLAVPDGTSVWCSWQTDKVYPKHPAPQTSVMVIDCAAAKSQWGWRIAEVLDHLRKTGTKEEYHKFMHAEWMTPLPARIGDEWNHLNHYVKGKTRLLHYTKEPTQPWYVPDHPLAHLWKMELQIALNEHYVGDEEIEAAVANYGVREDWRPTNGLHPSYADFLKKRAGKYPGGKETKSA